MSRSSGGHLRYDPHKLADVATVVPPATPLGQAGAPPTAERFRRWITNTQTEEVAREVYSELVCESGHSYCEMLLAGVKLSKATVVDFAAVTTPVLVMGGGATDTAPRGTSCPTFRCNATSYRVSTTP